MDKGWRFGKIFRDWFTGPDGVTYDPARMLWFVGIVSFLCFTGHWVYTGHEFNMVNFGIAFSSLLVAGGIGVKVKESSEPPATVAAVTSAFIPPPPLAPAPAPVAPFTPPPPLVPTVAPVAAVSPVVITPKPVSKTRRPRSAK